uniref:DUF148 domain-containing protein n=1 Tax=Syphacia muris TaxID=451379 RepID=A0A0N5AUS0_9BILA
MRLCYVTCFPLFLLLQTAVSIPCNWSGWGSCDSTRSFLNASDAAIGEYDGIISNVYLTSIDLRNSLDRWAEKQDESVKEAYEKRKQQVLSNTDQANQLRLRLAENSTDEVLRVMQQLIQISTNQSISPVQQSIQISEIMNSEPDAVALEILNIEHQVVSVGLQKTYIRGNETWIPENSAFELNLNLDEVSSGTDVEVNGIGEEEALLTPNDE